MAIFAHLASASFDDNLCS